MTRDTAAIIVAGGQGFRFGGKTRKQYVVLNGHPILWWSLRAFKKCPSIAQIILVVPADDLQSIKYPDVRVVAGGPTRTDSVREGLKRVNPGIRWVAVHDAVRPLVSPKLIKETIRQARQCGAAIAAVPSKDTVKLANGDGCIHMTPPRDQVWLAQTPQVFERRLLEKAHGLASSPTGAREKVGLRVRAPTPALSRLSAGKRVKITDDSQLVERLGIRVRLVEGSPENLKITRPLDLVLAKNILRNSPL